jgi:hypothetical protein
MCCLPESPESPPPTMLSHENPTRNTSVVNTRIPLRILGKLFNATPPKKSRNEQYSATRHDRVRSGFSTTASLRLLFIMDQIHSCVRGDSRIVKDMRESGGERRRTETFESESLFPPTKLDCSSNCPPPVLWGRHAVSAS